jgi:organic hydroperoxide reductase OsmC/OhrA
MKGAHHYNATIKWTGNKGTGTSSYRDYERSHSILVTDKAEILGSSDPAFRGDKTKHNPEDLLLASLSSCHMLWYLHLCAEANVVVVNYVDNAIGTMLETENGGGHFSEVTLQPLVTVSNETMVEKANELHQKANELFFIANSVNFPVLHKSICLVA